MDYDALRSIMIERQLTARGITDKRVLEAFLNVSRHEFVPTELRAASYGDHPLPIGEGQTISQPYMVALMTQALGLSGNEKILEIGTGSGYQSAILARLAKEVYSVERLKGLSEKAGEILARLGHGNVKLRVGDGTLGWEEHAPYDRIIVSAAAPAVPGSCIEQLANNGRLVIPVGSMSSQSLLIIEKKGNKIISRDLGGCVFVPLLGKEGWKKNGNDR